MRQPKGKLTPDGDFATIEFERVYRHRPEHVWDAIATPEGLREWLFCTEAVIDGCAGGRFDTVSGPAGYRSKGMILEWDPPHVLEYEWSVAPVPEMPLGENATLRYELTPVAGGTRLVVIYRRLTRHTASGFLPGLDAFLERLEAQLDGRPLPDWFARFQALRGEYEEWSRNAPCPGE